MGEFSLWGLRGWSKGASVAEDIKIQYLQEDKMNSNYKFIEDKEKNDELMSIYFNFINGKYLERALSFL